jgi:hypothetical protein
VSILVLYIHTESSLDKIWELNMSFLKKKNNAAFVFFIITLYAFLGFGLGFIIWEYVL